MSYSFPPELDRLVREELSTGVYASEDELLLEAVHALRDRGETVKGIGEGLADLQASRVRPLGVVDAEIRKKYDLRLNA
jgi:Arc/MetJ-type ribon-helix-helix transcriptional regulator